MYPEKGEWSIVFTDLYGPKELTVPEAGIRAEQEPEPWNWRAFSSRERGSRRRTAGSLRLRSGQALRSAVPFGFAQGPAPVGMTKCCRAGTRLLSE